MANSRLRFLAKNFHGLQTLDSNSEVDRFRVASRKPIGNGRHAKTPSKVAGQTWKFIGAESNNFDRLPSIGDRDVVSCDA